MSENEAMAGSTSRHEQAEVLRQHYESISLRASDWCNQIPIAIDLWERWPDLERQLSEAQAAVAKGGIVIYNGLSVPKHELDEVQANVVGVVLNGARRTPGGYMKKNRSLYYEYARDSEPEIDDTVPEAVGASDTEA